MADSSTPVAIPEALEEGTTGSENGLEARVIVYNCECHTFQEVVNLFCAIIPGMNSTKAFELAWRIHHEGQATVYNGDWKTAEAIAKQLAAGGLRVVVQ